MTSQKAVPFPPRSSSTLKSQRCTSRLSRTSWPRARSSCRDTNTLCTGTAPKRSSGFQLPNIWALFLNTHFFSKSGFIISEVLVLSQLFGYGLKASFEESFIPVFCREEFACPGVGLVFYIFFFSKVLDPQNCSINVCDREQRGMDDAICKKMCQGNTSQKQLGNFPTGESIPWL